MKKSVTHCDLCNGLILSLFLASWLACLLDSTMSPLAVTQWRLQWVIGAQLLFQPVTVDFERLQTQVGAGAVTQVSASSVLTCALSSSHRCNRKREKETFCKTHNYSTHEILCLLLGSFVWVCFQLRVITLELVVDCLSQGLEDESIHVAKKRLWFASPFLSSDQQWSAVHGVCGLNSSHVKPVKHACVR